MPQIEIIKDLEKICLSSVNSNDKEKFVQKLFKISKIELLQPVKSNEIQNHVDIVVMLIDVAAKTNQLHLLDNLFEELNPTNTQIEVSVALLSSSRKLSDKFKFYYIFAEKLIKNLNSDKNTKIINYIKKITNIS